MKKLSLILSFALASGVLVISCKKKDVEPDMNMMQSTYNYEFNNGQVVLSAAYSGMHPDNLMATMKVEENSATQTRITVTLTNTVSGSQYMIQAFAITLEDEGGKESPTLEELHVIGFL